jgi:UDP-3-O-acyl-N-acetylglucosamine deacetylase
LLGKPLLGSVECFAPGHKLNQKLVFKILNDKDNYKIEDSYVDVSYDAYTNVLNKDSLSPNLINVA